MRPEGEPRKDTAGSNGIDDDIGEQERCSVRQECLSSFHQNSIPTCECNYEHCVLPPRKTPVVSCVRKRARERKIRKQVSPMGGLDQRGVDIVDCCFGDGD